MNQPPKKKGEYERPSKTTAKDVIDYEIDMLEYCAERVLASPADQLSRDDLAFLEAFLLHFRILLEFFGKPKEDYRDNLYFQEPVTCGIQPSEKALAAVKTIAKASEAKWGTKLNKFLAHPTERRYTTARSWPVDEMRGDMLELVAHWRDCWG